jgi:hypothetical protein
MAEDMKAITNTSVLYRHAAPAINTPRVYPVGTMNAGVFLSALTILEIDYIYIDMAQQVWYGVDGNFEFDSYGDNDPNTPLTPVPIAWYAAKMILRNNTSTTPPTLEYVEYFQAADNSGYASIDNPCPNAVTRPAKHPPDLTYPNAISTLTFPYDRGRAAEYAAIQSRYHTTINPNTQQPYIAPFIPNYVLGDGQPTTRPHPTSPNATVDVFRVTSDLSGNPPSLIYADFSYLESNLGSANDERKGRTGSGFFISEAIWMGGMPMTTVIGDQGCISGASYATTGWHYCYADSADFYWGTIRWRAHYGIIGNFTGYTIRNNSATISETEDCEDTLDNHLNLDDYTIHPSEKVWDTTGADGIIQLPNSVDPPNTTDFYFVNSGQLTLSNTQYSSISASAGEVTNAELLHDALAFYNVAQNIVQGDYLFIEPLQNKCATDKEDAHGFVVVGWGLAKNCKDVMDGSKVPSLSFKDLSDPSTGVYMVPYVSDFSGWYPDYIHNPLPRPFYCTKYKIGGDSTGFATVHDWIFIKFPDSVTINPSNLYVSNNWIWP